MAYVTNLSLYSSEVSTLSLVTDHAVVVMLFVMTTKHKHVLFNVSDKDKAIEQLMRRNLATMTVLEAFYCLETALKLLEQQQ
ncbi:hypothetical protein NPIL_401531 [Nephila pilipes]|uniref:Uncharacterized protein n=1 Tax=Nephila pilipes TaxID=299642 RepID=A0A8X6U7U2_NEPPI|nr:hypothetical protein NPIL_401531 [Nephila pilipes]